MTDFPTVGLRVDLSGIDQGDKAYEKLQKRIEGVGDAAEATERKVQAAATKTKASAAGATKASSDAAKAEARAQQDAARAEERANKERERQRRYLQQVRIRSIQMEEAARRAAQVEETRAAAMRVREAERVAKEIERQAKAAARAEEVAARQAQRARDKATNDALRERLKADKEAERSAKALARAEEQAARQQAAAAIKAEREVAAIAARETKRRETEERRALAESEKNRRYLERVRINSAKMEAAAEREAAKEAERAAREMAKVQAAAAKQAQSTQAIMEAHWAKLRATGGLGGGGGGRGGAGGGGAGSPFSRGDLAIMAAFESGLTKIRHGLTETRRLFLDVRTAIGVFLAGMVVSPILQMADAMTALRARAGAFTEQASDVPYLMEAIYQAAQRSRSPMESIATLYTRLAPLAKQLGKSQMELLRISETVSKGFQIGGATPEEAKSAAQQLAQALASNRLGGDELRSLAENAPILMQKISASLNMNTGQFIKWAHEGKANAAVVIKALEDAQQEIDRLFAKFPVTIGQATTMVQNALANLVGRVDEATGASRALATSIAQFANFLDSEGTLKAVTAAVNGMGVAFRFLGDAFDFVVSMWPAIATVLAGMAAARLMAIVKGWQALRTAMLAFAAASAVAGRASATLIVAQSALSAAATGAAAAFRGLLAAVGGPLGAAIIALSVGFSVVNAAQNTLAESTQKTKDAFDRSTMSLLNARGVAEKYKIDLDSLDGAIKAMNDASIGSKAASDAAAEGHDKVAAAARERAKAEIAAAGASLLAQGIDARKEADKIGRANTINRFAQGVSGLAGRVPVLGKEYREDAARRAAISAEAAKNQALLNQSAEIMQRQGQELIEKARSGAFTVTSPTTAGAPAAAAAKKDSGTKGLEGAIDRIARMRAEVEGLKREIATISANPLTELAAQIRAAGNEAAASMEAGGKKNQALADQARSVASERERLTIMRDLIKESAVNTANIENEAESYRNLASAQQLSTDMMQAFWGNGGGTYEAYTQALEQSRAVLTENAVAESNLQIARRFGVNSLSELEGALQAYIGAGDEANAVLVKQAQAEATAAEAAIRRKAALDAIASKDEDFAGYNEKTFEGLERALDHMTVLSDTLGDSLASAFGRGGRAAQSMLRIISSQRQRELAGARQIADAVGKYGKESAEAKKEEARVSKENELARIQGYADMASAAKSFFKEGSAGYKVMMALEIALHTLTTLNTLKAMALDAAHTTTSVGNSGVRAAADGAAAYAKTLASLPFPFNLAAGAAVLAALASVGVAITGGGGGSAPKSRMEDRQRAQGAGTVLGDAAAKSESIARSLEIVAANSNSDLEFSNDMLAALRSIDTNISSLTAALARQLGVGGSLSTDGLGLGTITSGPSTLQKILNPFSALLPGLFGKKVTTTLQDAGLSFGSASLSDILANGISGNTYQDLAVQTKKKFFGITTSNKTKYQTVTGALDADVQTEIGRVIASLRDGVLSAASILGADSAKALLDAMIINIGDVSLKDMTGEEIEAALQSVFSKVGDQMAGTAVPAILELQKAGEGAFETLSRVAREYQVVDMSLASIGLQFGAVGLSSLKARQRLVDLAGGIDELTSQVDQYAQDFLTDAERMAPVIKAVYTELGRLGYGSIKTKDEFKALVNSLDLTTETGAATFATLMKIAPAFAKIVDYTTGLTAANDNVTDAQGRLNDAYETAADLITETRDRFQDFVDSFKAFRQELEVGGLAENSPQDQYLKTKALFDSTSAAALAGDETALANLQSVSEAYLNASRDYYASTEPYFRDLERVKMAIEAAQGYAQTQVDKADAQLAALNQLVAGWVEVNTSVLTVEQAVRAVETELGNLVIATSQQAQALQAALAAAQQAAQQAANAPPAQSPTTATPPPTNTGPSSAGGYAAYVASNSDLAAYYAQHSGGGLGDMTMAEYGQLHWQKWGQYEDRDVVPFAKGGAFDGSGVVTTPTYFDMGQMAEDGSEAIMPLARTADGDLGVRTTGGGDNKLVVEALDRVSEQLKISNVLARAGYTSTVDALAQVKEEVADVQTAIRKAS